MGERFLNVMKDNGMIYDGIIKLTDRPTTVKTRIIGHSQQIVRVDKESCIYLNSKDEVILIEIVTKLIAIVKNFYQRGIIFLSYFVNLHYA